MSGDAPAVLVLEDLVMRFGGVTAVDGISLNLGASERLAVIGPNGAGKTTLFKMIAGDLQPTSGRVTLFGDDVTHRPEFRRARMGLSRTFQISNLLADVSVLDNVRLAAQAGTPVSRRFWWPQTNDDSTQESLRVLSDVGLDGRAQDTVADLSHGEQRQLEIAMALVTNPRLLLLDEPAAGLSGAERQTLRRLLTELPRDLPYLLIEHDMSIALEFSDRVLCMDNGKPVILDTPEAVREDPTVKAIYLGRSAA
ncbi:MAG: ABC transporter ATP-binding protein [Beutenbergiaceae bacterium]